MWSGCRKCPGEVAVCGREGPARRTGTGPAAQDIPQTAEEKEASVRPGVEGREDLWGRQDAGRNLGQASSLRRTLVSRQGEGKLSR